MNYFAEEGKGEICIRGPNVFSEYYKDPEKTYFSDSVFTNLTRKEAFDSEGFFMTGGSNKLHTNDC